MTPVQRFVTTVTLISHKCNVINEGFNPGNPFNTIKIPVGRAKILENETKQKHYITLDTNAKHLKYI